MDVAEEHTGRITVVEIKGRIDTNSAPVLSEKLLGVVKSGRAIVVDLKHVAFITSAGFRALLLAGQGAAEANGTLALCGLSAELQRLFDIGAFTERFAIYPSRKDVLAKLS
jgi:anti-sigma B factor antagonist